MFSLPARVTCRTESSALFIIIHACSNGACLVYAWAYDSISLELLKYFTLLTFKKLYFANFGNVGIQKSSSHLKNFMRLKILKKHETIWIYSCISKIQQILKFGMNRFFGGKCAVFDHYYIIWPPALKWACVTQTIDWSWIKTLDKKWSEFL